MGYQIDRELAFFRREAAQLAQALSRGSHGPWTGTEVVADGWVFTPPTGQKAKGGEGAKSTKTIALTIFGMIHGNERAGLAVLNSLIEMWKAGRLAPPLGAFALVLGNPAAAEKNVRFLERDLNRSFGREQNQLLEEKRADELEKILTQTAMFFDIHQTKQPGDRPFFIFPYSRNGLSLARAIAPQVTVVTHWGKPFSNDGRCSDEFVNSCGGTGITIELGQNSLNPYHVAVGVEAAIWAIGVADEALQGGEKSPKSGLNTGHCARDGGRAEGELFTWAAVVPYPPSGEVALDPGWNNFRYVKAGERLGTIDLQPLLSPAAGFMLFPKYNDPVADAGLPRPSELCRLMKPISDSDLPQL